MNTIFETILILLVPAIITWLSAKLKVIQKIGSITVCYALGFLMSLLPFHFNADVSELVLSVSITLATSLMLFGSDIRSIRTIGNKMLTSFISMSVIVIIVSSAAALIGTRCSMPNAAELSGAAAGLYIGGTANLFAVGKALLKDNLDIINSAFLADSIAGGIYFFVLLSAGKKIYSKFLKTEASTDETYTGIAGSDKKGNETIKTKIVHTIIALLLAALCFGIGVLIEYVINGNLDGSLFIILTASVLGIVFSLYKPIRELRESDALSKYLMLVFAFCIGMSIDLSTIGEDVASCIIYFGSIQIVSALIHLIACKIMKIDGGTAMITSVAAIFGPPFVVVAAKSYGDDRLAPPGVICGIAGMVFGNILGIALGKLLILIC